MCTPDTVSLKLTVFNRGSLKKLYKLGGWDKFSRFFFTPILGGYLQTFSFFHRQNSTGKTTKKSTVSSTCGTGTGCFTISVTIKEQASLKNAQVILRIFVPKIFSLSKV